MKKSSQYYHEITSKKMLRPYYVITFIVITLIYIWGEFPPLSGAGNYVSTGRIIVFIVLFVFSCCIGYKDFHLKWRYPAIVAVFAYIVPPLIAFVIHSSVDAYYFGHYMAFNLYFSIPILLFSGYLGMGMGALMQKFEKVGR